MKSYMKLHDTLVEAMDLKVGDTVRVLRKAKSYEYGWNAEWNPSMTAFVGKTFTIARIQNDLIRFNDNDWSWPIHILEKLHSVYEFDLDSGEYTAVVKECGNIEVGCQKICFETLKAIYTAAKKRHDEDF